MGVHGRTWAYIVRPQKNVGIFFVGVHVRPCTPMGVQLCGRTNFLWAYNVRPCTPMGVLGVLGVICGRTGRTWAYKGVHGRNIAGANAGGHYKLKCRNFVVSCPSTLTKF